jgi:hypothetical protein
MYSVCFGNHPDFCKAVAGNLDHSRFVAEYGLSEATDLEQFDCIVPFHFNDYRVLETKRGLQGSKYWIPSGEIEELCKNKWKFNRRMVEMGFDELIPALYGAKDQIFPYILKKRLDEDGQNSHVVRNSDDEASIVHLLESPDYFIQAYVVGNRECSIHGLMAEGKLYYSQLVEFEMGLEYFAKGGAYHAHDVTYHGKDEHIRFFLPALEALNYSGTFCLDYKMVGDRPKLFELNPRCGYSLFRDVDRYLDCYLRSLRPA